MKRLMVPAMVATIVTVSAAAAPAPSHSKHFVSRIEHCSQLDRQLATVLNKKRTVRHAAEARELQGKARQLCASRREAQGIRTYADALKLLGVRPIDDRRMRPKPVPKSKETQK